MLDLVAVGDVMLDVRLPGAEPGARLHAPVVTTAGGSAVNAALAAARLGARAAVVGAVGGDAAGRMVRDALAAAGVEARLATVTGPTGTCVYTGTAVVADPGANAAFEIPSLPKARVTLVSGYLGAARIAAALAAATGLTAVDLQDTVAPVDGADVILGSFLDPNAVDAEIVCATLGAQGAVAFGRGGRAEAHPARTLPEPLIGAGDAFAAGFLLALADGESLQTCVERGCAAVA